MTVRLSTSTDWTVEIHEDGSGEVGVFMQPDSKAKFPPDTFDFPTLRDEFLNRHTEQADCSAVPTAFFLRSERGYADGKGIPDWELAKQVLEKAISAAMNKGPRFDVCCRNVPFKGPQA